MLALTERMIDGLRKISLPVFAPEPGIHRGHIVAIGDKVGSQHDSTDDPAMQSLYKALTEGGARLTIRRGILRLSFNFYNNEDDVDRVLEIASDWKSKN